VVAVSSRPKALEAWGTHQDLFAQGEAVELDKSDPAAKAALEHPGRPLTRPIGSNGEFKLEADGRPDIPTPKGGRRIKRSPPDRSRLDKAEAARDRLVAEEEETLGRLADEKQVLENRITAAKADFADRRKAAETEVRDALKAYRSAGGQGSASKSPRSTT
jgi:hypothetical protein